MTTATKKPPSLYGIPLVRAEKGARNVAPIQVELRKLDKVFGAEDADEIIALAVHYERGADAKAKKLLDGVRATRKGPFETHARSLLAAAASIAEARADLGLPKKIETVVDGKPAHIVDHGPADKFTGEQLTLDGIMPSIGTLVLELAKTGVIIAQREALVDERKQSLRDAQAALDEVTARRDRIHRDLQKRGSQLLDLKVNSADFVREGAFVINGTTGEVVAKVSKGGDYPRIPQLTSKVRCVCGAHLTDSDADHDRVHAAYLRRIEAELAPNAATAPAAAGAP